MFAADKDASSDAARAEALFQKGREASAAGRAEEALAAYRDAFAIDPRYDIAGNLGRTELSLEKYRDAAEHLDFSLQHLPASASPDQRARVLELVQDARSHVGALRIAVDVAGADVLVDGKPVGKAPIERQVFVDVGNRVVRARTPSGETKEVVAVGVAGVVTEVHVVFAAPPITAPTTAPTASASVPPPPAQSPEASSGNGLFVGILAGGAALGVGLGVAFAVLSNSAASDADDLAQPGGRSACLDPRLAGPCGELSSALEDRDTYGNAALVSFGVAAALAAGAVGVIVLSPSSDAKTGRVTVSPVVGQQNGVALGGTF